MHITYDFYQQAAKLPADKIINAMVATVKSGLGMPEDDVLPGPIKLHSKAATVYMNSKYKETSEAGLALSVTLC